MTEHFTIPSGNFPIPWLPVPYGGNYMIKENNGVLIKDSDHMCFNGKDSDVLISYGSPYDGQGFCIKLNFMFSSWSNTSNRMWLLSGANKTFNVFLLKDDREDIFLTIENLEHGSTNKYKLYCHTLKLQPNTWYLAIIAASHVGFFITASDNTYLSYHPGGILQKSLLHTTPYPCARAFTVGNLPGTKKYFHGEIKDLQLYFYNVRNCGDINWVRKFYDFELLKFEKFKEKMKAIELVPDVPDKEKMIQDNNGKKCMICSKEIVNNQTCMLAPCGHTRFCFDCVVNNNVKSCLLCDMVVEKTYRTYA